jgi:hypothetical protein
LKNLPGAWSSCWVNSSTPEAPQILTALVQLGTAVTEK